MPKDTESLSSLTKKWLQQIAPYQHHKLILKPAAAALMVIDMQNYFVDPQGRAFIPGTQEILPNIQKLITAFRKAERPVIYTTHVHKPDGSDAGIMGWWWDDMILEGEDQAEIYSSIAPNPDEKIIIKHRYSAFYNTDLETILRRAKVEDLVITGVMTNLCCESTARDAYYRDYRAFFPADATTATREEMHVATLMNLAYGFAYIGTTQEMLAEVTQTK
jgi:ureidoacrylate peracid hydrolase